MNEKGFYESNKITYMNDDLLKSAGSAWFTWKEFNKEWFSSPDATKFHNLALANLQEVYGASYMPLLKDPRMCLLIPFWEQVLSVAGYGPKYVHVHRNPVEVAGSLQHWAGYDPAYGQILWLRYMLEAEAATRNKSRVFTSFHLLIQDWQQVAQSVASKLDISWPSPSSQVNTEIDDFLDSNLNHMAKSVPRSDAAPKLTPWIAHTLAIMDRWSKTGEDPADWPALDAILSQFNQTTPEFLPLVEAGRRDSLALQMGQQEDRRKAAKLEAAEARAATVRAELATLKVEQVEAIEEARKLKDHIAYLESALQECSLETNNVEQRLSAAKAERDMLIAERQSQKDALQEALHRSAVIEAERDQIRNRLQQLLEDSRRQIERQNEKLTLQQQKIATLTRETQKLQDERHILLRDLRNEKLRHEQVMRDRFTAALKDSREQIERQNEKLSLQEQQIAALSREQNELTHRQQAAEEHVQAMLTSSSWRLTRPLRRIALSWRDLRNQ